MENIPTTWRLEMLEMSSEEMYASEYMKGHFFFMNGYSQIQKSWNFDLEKVDRLKLKKVVIQLILFQERGACCTQHGHFHWTCSLGEYFIL